MLSGPGVEQRVGPKSQEAQLMSRFRKSYSASKSQLEVHGDVLPSTYSTIDSRSFRSSAMAGRGELHLSDGIFLSNVP